MFFGQTEASVKRPWSASHARKEEWRKKKTVCIPNLLFYVLVKTYAMHFLCLSLTVGLFGIKRRASPIASSIEHDTLRFCWKIFDYHMIFTNQFYRNSGSVGSICFFALLPCAHLTLVSVRQWDAKKLRRFCKQDKAWRDIVGNKLSIRKIFLNIELPSQKWKSLWSTRI